MFVEVVALCREQLQQTQPRSFGYGGHKVYLLQVRKYILEKGTLTKNNNNVNNQC